ISSDTDDPNLANNADSVSTTVTPQADLSVDKSGPATVNADGSITYSLDVANNGPSDATNVSVTDTLPAGVTSNSANAPAGWGCTHSGNTIVTCTRAAWATGSTDTITITVTAPAQGGAITNTATIGSNTSDPVAGNNTDSVTTTVTPQADLALV